MTQHLKVSPWIKNPRTFMSGSVNYRHYPSSSNAPALAL